MDSFALDGICLPRNKQVVNELTGRGHETCPCLDADSLQVGYATVLVLLINGLVLRTYCSTQLHAHNYDCKIGITL